MESLLKNKSIEMKKLRIIISSFFVFSLLFFANCGDDGNEITLTQQQIATQSLVDGSSWSVSNVVSKPDPGINTTELESLSITFAASGTGANITPSGISTAGAPTFLNTQSGATWSWSGTGTSTIDLVNASVSQFTSITFTPNAENPTSLSLSFNVSESGGRTQGLVGSYTIELTPQ